ncbi:MAG TPA: hypothetical protein VF669_14310 [Tepidisphaeraceae bacterium]|jgi:anti-sigma factor RsiW
MSVSDNDLELLETYLDGELSPREVDALIDRLRGEPVLASAMETLKSERAVRLAVWQNYEPGEEVVGRLMTKVEKRVDDHWSWTRRLSGLRRFSGAAACLLIGIMVGRMNWGGNSTTNVAPAGPAPRDQVAVDIVKPVTKAPTMEVPIVDSYGRVVAYERMEVPERGEPVQEREPVQGNVVPVADEF